MRTRSLILPFLVSALLFGCADTPKPSDSSEWNELSVYHLPDDWVTQHGESFQFENLQGQVVVVVMIYTSCQAACPRLVADMRRIETGVKDAVRDQVTYVLVSIDPETDTPERLKAFAEENGMTSAQWLLLRGTDESVRTFANVVAVKYKQISPIDFSHSNIISVFDKEGVMQYQQEGLGTDNTPLLQSVHSLTTSSTNFFERLWP
jgi:protein SCO1/2